MRRHRINRARERENHCFSCRSKLSAKENDAFNPKAAIQKLSNRYTVNIPQ
jgi:hypothetical protein